MYTGSPGTGHDCCNMRSQMGCDAEPVLLELWGCAGGGKIADLLRPGLAHEGQVQASRIRSGLDLECAGAHHARRTRKAQ